jgi:accessory secretory protein Asp2
MSDERVFAGSWADLRYVLHEATARPDVLAVGFSAVHTPDEAPAYHYRSVVRDVPCHRLFVLDDHGPREPLPRPTWYLGRDLDVADTVCELLEATAAELGVARERVITFGSSKGGWAALYFGARCGAGHAVAGEPQTLLGRHLLQEENLTIAQHVAGATDAEAGARLDALVFDAFRAADPAPRVHVYSGRGSPYYQRDVVPLLHLLDELGIPWELDLGEHSEHVPDLGLRFPGYLTRRLGELLAAKPVS